jgi:hypothetical protein
VLLSTYAHLIDEYEDLKRVDAELEIAKARDQVCAPGVRQSARGTATATATAHAKSPV